MAAMLLRNEDCSNAFGNICVQGNALENNASNAQMQDMMQPRNSMARGLERSQ